MTSLRRAIRYTALACTAAFALACGSATGAGTASFTVALTDAPDTLLQSATVTIGKIQLIPDSGSAITLTDSGGTYDLLKLQDGVTANLATLSIPAGQYEQLRMVVDSASVTLKPAYTFKDGSQTKSLKIPSGAQSGIKVDLSSAGDSGGSGLNIVQGQTILLVDFDVAQNFVVQGNPGTPAGISGILFTPLLRAVVQNVAGSIAGTVSGPSHGGLTVTATQTNAGEVEALQTTKATAVTDTDGTYIIRYLAPGTYSVAVDSTTTTPASQSVTVGTAQAVTGIDFTTQ